MKIAFIGAQGTGKTTLVYELTAELKKRGLHALPLPEVVRDCPFPINEATTKKAQIWIITSQIARELELSRKADHVICDRSILDAYTYFFNKFGHDEVYYNLTRKWLKTYDLLFKVSATGKYLSNDGFRSTNVQFQREIDTKLRQLLKEMKQPFHTFNSMEEVMNMIMKNKAKPL